MPITREQLEKREDAALAPYAQRSSATRGRVYPEIPPEWRTHFQRDRDRVVHSRAFRRLEYKTQVFLNGSTGDHLRTRLTHTMEVASIARNIALALGLNTDLVETIALAHDLGHPPFGHCGEACLNELMKDHGGFEHNLQSLRVVDVLEQKYPYIHGLNLSWEVREGLAKHHSGYDNPPELKMFDTPNPSLEAQVADLADEIAYYSHDLDDGLEADLLTEGELERDVVLWRETSRNVREQYGVLPEGMRTSFITRCMIDMQVHDVVIYSEKLIRQSGITCAGDARHFEKPLIQYSPERSELNLALREYLYNNLYLIPSVSGPNNLATMKMRQIFVHVMRNPGAFLELVSNPEQPQADLYRSLCDSIAQMTDRSLLQLYDRIFHRHL